MKKFLTSITFLFLVLFLPNMAAQAATGSQIAQTETTVTYSWQPQDGAVSYTMYLNDIAVAQVDASQTSYTYSNLAPGSQYDVKVEYTYLSAYTGTAYTSTTAWSTIKTVPAKVTGVNQQKWWYFIESVDASWDRQPGVDGYEYAFFNSKNKKIDSGTVGNYSESPYASLDKADNAKVFYVKVRAYQDLGDYSSHNYIYGPWSSKAILFTQPMVKEDSTKVYTTTKTKNGKKVSTTKLSVKWDKVSGMDKYKVYVSTKEKSGYKLVKTVNGKTTAATITKLGKNNIKKNKTYYVYVVGIKKVDGKTYTSGRHYTVSVKNSSTTLNWTFDK